MVLGVLLVEALSVNVAAVGDTFGRFPIAILVLVGVTVFVLSSIAMRRR